MAEKAAHIVQANIVQPSIFELISSEYLNATFYPAFRKISLFLASIKPKELGFLSGYYDEIFLLFNSIVQSYYIEYKGGSLSEVFYGLTRYSKRRQDFSKFDKKLSLLLLVVLPYLFHKLDNYVKIWDDGNRTANLNVLKKFCLTLVPQVKAAWELIKTVNYIMYIGKISTSHSPELSWCDLALKHLPEDNLTWSDLLQGKIRLTIIVSNVLLRGLELSAFFLQFLHWWKNESTVGDLSKLPISTPPELNANERYTQICPICLQNWDIPTVVAVSGYVYCYKCINNRQKKCSVTGYPITLNDLVRIYDEE